VFVVAFLLLFAGDASQANELLKQGLMALQANQLQTAQKDLEAAAAISPDNPYIWTSLARAYWRMQDKKKAFASAQNAAKFSNHNAAVAHALAIFYTDAEDYKKAALFEEEYATSKQADRDALGRAADLYLNAGYEVKGLQLAKQAYTASASAQDQNRLGRALLANKEIAEGTSNLAAAWKSDPASETFSFDYAQALLRQGNFTAASDALQPAFLAHPKNAQLALALGVARYGQRRFDEAIAAFLNTVAIDPSLPQPYEFLGKMLDQAGSRLPEILKAYETWNRNAPDRFEAPLLLAKAQVTAGANSTEIEQNLRKSIQLKSDFWESHYQLGQLLVKRRDFKGAEQELLKSIELSPNQPMPHYHLARVYDRLGNSDKAKAERETHARLQAQQ
jgi:Flp pilus assembly protein TadD